MEGKLSGSGDGASQEVAAGACTYSGVQAVALGIHMACEGHTTLALASALGRWRRDGEGGKEMGQAGTTATELLGLAPSVPSTGLRAAVVALEVEQLLCFAEPVLARIEVTYLFAPGVLKQEGRSPRLLVAQMQAQRGLV